MTLDPTSEPVDLDGDVVPASATVDPPDAVHVAVDVEALDANARALVLHVGLVRFTVRDGLLDELDLPIRWFGEHLDGNMVRSICPRAVALWLAQGEAAREAALREPRIGLGLAVNRIVDFTRDLGPASEWWASGDLDLLVLGNVFADRSLPPPWRWSQVRRARAARATLAASAEIEASGATHVALADARATARIARAAKRQALALGAA